MNRVIIGINKPESSTDRKTMVLPSRRRKKLGRRRGDPRMNFWDLGMVSTGPSYIEWEMLDFQPSACPYGTSSQTFDTTWHQELLDKIFEVPVEDWATHYKKIVPDMDYPLTIGAQSVDGFFLSTQYDLDSSEPNFTNAGLKVESTFFDDNKLLGLNRLGSGILWFRTQFLQKGASSSTSGVKVTDTYDPGADEVDFQPSKSCDVFLVPALPYALCRFLYFEPGGATAHTEQLNEFFHLPDRAIFLNPAHELNGVNDFVNFLNTGAGEEGSTDEYDRFLLVADHMKSIAGARARYLITAPNTWGDFADVNDFGAVLPGTYSYTPPPPITEGTVSMSCSLNGNTQNTALIGSSDNQMLLRAVIKQDGQFFYVWNFENVP